MSRRSKEERVDWRHHWMALGVSFVVMSLVTLVGVMFWFRPVLEADEPGGPLTSAPVNLAIYSMISVLLYDWAVRRFKALFDIAFVMGASQYILVIDLTLRGERGLATAGASAVLIFATWASVALVYSLLARRRG